MHKNKMKGDLKNTKNDPHSAAVPRIVPMGTKT